MASPLQQEEYDIIICGGGTAGCVLAHRLSEDTSLSILMLEAGEDANDDFRVMTPGAFPTLMGSDRDWNFMTEPEPALNNRIIAQPRGKAIGGSSAINVMSLLYPSAAQLDAWAGLGNPGWAWKDMLPYYQKPFRRYPPTEEIKAALGLPNLDDNLRNPSGPIAASYPPQLNSVLVAWVETWKKIGRTWANYPLGEGLSAGGFITNAAVDPDKAQRSHAGNEYWAPVSTRKNLHTITGAMIDKVELDATDPNAVIPRGVTFAHSGARYTVKAKREVILTAGVFGSPAILERSGVGDNAVLEGLGIQTIVDNPGVGSNLQDHLFTQLTMEVKDGVPSADVLRDPAAMQKAMEMYQTTRTGPLAAAGGYTFANIPLSDCLAKLPEGELQDLFDHYLPTDTKPTSAAEQKMHAFCRSIIESKDEASVSNCMSCLQVHADAPTIQEVFSFSSPENYVTFLVALSHPFARGHSHIQSTDCTVYPRIFCNYLGHPLDLEILARHVMQSEQLAATAPLSDLIKPGGARIPAGSSALTLEGAKEIVRSNSASNYHPCGTCAMMSKELGGVVDDRLRVYGVKGLRVIDASIFPIIPRSNIMTSVYAVAEKGADVLREDLA